MKKMLNRGGAETLRENQMTEKINGIEGLVNLFQETSASPYLGVV
jgi:hypothetical protein